MARADKFFLFDIDGTLLTVNKYFMQTLIQDMISGFGLDDVVFDGQSFAGRTDRDIFSGLMRLNGIPEERFDDFRAAYLEYLERNMKPEFVRPISGADLAVSYCTESGLPIGLLTGNFREAAFIKLNRAGMDSFFDTGAFGCDHGDRKDLPEIAYHEGRKLIGSKLQPSDLVIIGDTPNDISCAKHFGAFSVAVSTGNFSYEQLSACEPDLMLADLTNPETWLQQIPD